MTDKQPQNSEPAALHHAAGARPSRHGQVFGAQRSSVRPEKKPLAGDDAEPGQNGDEAPALSDKYDLSLVDEERELRRQARRR